MINIKIPSLDSLNSPLQAFIFHLWLLREFELLTICKAHTLRTWSWIEVWCALKITDCPDIHKNEMWRHCVLSSCSLFLLFNAHPCFWLLSALLTFTYGYRHLSCFYSKKNPQHNMFWLGAHAICFLYLKLMQTAQNHDCHCYWQSRIM